MTTENRLVIGRDSVSKKLAYYEGKGHCLTIAPARSGKLVSSIGPNVFFHTGSLFAVDPKSEIAHAFARVRSEGHKQKTYFLNPDHEKNGLPFHSVNPLAWLTPDSQTVASDAASIADILIEQEGGNNSHFSDEAANLVMGIILYCALEPGLPATMRNLIGVRRCLELGGDEQERLFRKMRNSEIPEIQAVALMVGEKSDNERAAVFSTAQRNTHFLADKAIQDVVGKADFDLRDLKSDNISVFLIIPPRYLGAWRKWYRLMVACAINAMMQTDIPTPDVQALFVLDELYALGRMDSIAIAAGLLPGLGLRLHLVMQSLSQLESRYEDIHQDLVANSGVVQAFNVSNPKDARFVQEMMAQTPKGIGAGGTPHYEAGQRLDQIMYESGDKVFVRMQGQAPKWYDKVVYYAAPELKQHPFYRFVNDKPLR